MSTVKWPAFLVSAQKIVGKRDTDFFDRQTADNLHQNDTKVLKDKIRLTTEEVNRNLGSHTEQVYLSVKPAARSGGQAYALCGISTDVTEQRQAAEEIHRLAYFDPLTQLPNRRALIDRMEREMAVAKRSECNGALVFIDLDHFKEVNDLMGRWWATNCCAPYVIGWAAPCAAPTHWPALVAMNLCCCSTSTATAIRPPTRH